MSNLNLMYTLDISKKGKPSYRGFKLKVAILKKAKNSELSRLRSTNYTSGVEKTLKL